MTHTLEWDQWEEILEGVCSGPEGIIHAILISYFLDKDQVDGPRRMFNLIYKNGYDFVLEDRGRESLWSGEYLDRRLKWKKVQGVLEKPPSLIRVGDKFRGLIESQWLYMPASDLISYCIFCLVTKGGNFHTGGRNGDIEHLPGCVPPLWDYGNVIERNGTGSSAGLSSDGRFQLRLHLTVLHFRTDAEPSFPILEN